jgi:hypothetical protein
LGKGIPKGIDDEKIYRRSRFGLRVFDQSGLCRLNGRAAGEIPGRRNQSRDQLSDMYRSGWRGGRTVAEGEAMRFQTPDWRMVDVKPLRRAIARASSNQLKIKRLAGRPPQSFVYAPARKRKARPSAISGKHCRYKS